LLVVEKNMKSSSNLVEATSSRDFTRAWNPSDFSVVVDTLPELKAEELALQIEMLQPERVSADIHTKAAPIQPEEVQPRAFTDKQSPVRRWNPVEVKQEYAVVEEILAQAQPLPTIMEDTTGPRLEQLREKLIHEMMEQAGQILMKVQTQGSEILSQAQEKAQEVLKSAQDQGWNDAAAETKPMIQTVQMIIHEVENWQAEMYSQSEAMVLNLVKEIAQTLFCEGMALEEAALQQTFNRVLSNARSLGDLRIFVNPEDAINLGPYWREYQVSLSGQQIDIIPLDSISRGGCFVEGHMGTVDGRVETQLTAIMDKITTTADAAGQTGN
jgi:flagellar biosynthesis/type III secretory pathway protein FliH